MDNTYRNEKEFDFLKKINTELKLNVKNFGKEYLDPQYQSEDIFIMELESL